MQRPEALDPIELLNEFKDIMRAAFAEHENQNKVTDVQFVQPDLGVIFKSFGTASDW